MVVCRFQTYATEYGDLTLGGAERVEVKSLCILETSIGSKLIFETHLCEIVSKETRSIGVVRRTGKFMIVRVHSRAVSMHMFIQPGVLYPRVDIVC